MLLSRYPVMGKLYEVLIRRINPEIRSYDKWEVYQKHLKGTIEVHVHRSNRGYNNGWSINYIDAVNRIFISKTKYQTITFEIMVKGIDSRHCNAPEKVYNLFKELIKHYPQSKCDFVQLGTGYILTRKKKKKEKS